MNNFRINSPTKKPPGVGTRVLGSLFFSFFMGLGLFFCWLIARDALAGLATWTWTKTPCEIGSSGVSEIEPRGRQTGSYYFQVQYHYNFNGHAYTSDRYEIKTRSFQDYSRAARLADLYRSESTAVCFVNPVAPAEAVLKRGSLFFPLFVLFPLIFVTIGAAGIYSMWRPQITRRQATQPISDQGIRPLGRRLGVGFFLIFVLVGSGVFYAIFLRPFLKILSAKQWRAVSCAILSSNVRSHSGSHGSTTYSVDILYRYEFNGNEFKANRYDFMGGSSSGSSGKYAIVSRYPRGARTICYVNPLDPHEAVLERGFTPTMWVGLIPLVFVLLGFAGVSGVLCRTRIGLSPQNDRTAVLPLSSSEAVPRADLFSANEPLLLKPRVSPGGKLIAALFFALFWNGIVSVFLVNLFKNWRSGPFEWFLALFLVPFVVIGLGILVAGGYFFLAAFNPRPRLTITPPAVPLGGTFHIGWEISGRTEVLKRLVIRLEGREEATYQSGKNTAMDRNVFANFKIADLTFREAMRSGAGNATVPAHLMHSFMGRHNKIVWAIRIQGEIARWPDIDEDFLITVLPSAQTSQNQSTHERA